MSDLQASGQLDAGFGQRLDGIEASVNELFRKTGHPGAESGDASFERKSAIEMCKSRHAITVNKVEEVEYCPSSAKIDQAMRTQDG